MTHKYLVLDRHAFADEGVALNLAPCADLGAFLNLHKSADRRIVTDLTPVEVHEGIQLHVAPQLHVGRDSTQQAISLSHIHRESIVDRGSSSSNVNLQICGARSTIRWRRAVENRMPA